MFFYVLNYKIWHFKPVIVGLKFSDSIGLFGMVFDFHPFCICMPPIKIIMLRVDISGFLCNEITGILGSLGIRNEEYILSILGKIKYKTNSMKVLSGNETIVLFEILLWPTTIGLCLLRNIIDQLSQSWPKWAVRQMIRGVINNAINITYSRKCSTVLLFGITRCRLSREWNKNCLFILRYYS